MQEQLIDFSNLFKDSVLLRIPDYQRGYSWKEEQLNDFWTDLSNLKLGKTHYMGVITLEEIKNEIYKKWEIVDLSVIEERNYKPYYVVDGHQRILNIIILIQAIIEKMDQDKIERLSSFTKEEIIKKYLFIEYHENPNYKTYLFGYEKDDPSYEFYKTSILGHNSTSNRGTASLYTRNLEYSKNFFEGKIKQFNYNELEQLFKKITLFLKFNVYLMTEELNSLVAFETMNNRGIELSNLELLKNRLIYLSTLLLENNSDGKPLRNHINNVWRRIYEFLGKGIKVELKDDKFLEFHWKMYFEYSRRKGGEYREFLLKKHFIVEKLDNYARNNSNELSNLETINSDDINNYINSLNDTIPAYYYIHYPNESTYDSNIKEWLSKLNRLNNDKDSQFTPLIMAILSKYGNNYRYNDRVAKVLERIEKFIFLLIKSSKNNSNFQDSHFFGWARKVYFDYKNLDETISEIDIWIKTFNMTKFSDMLLDNNKKYGKRFYNWDGLKYFLFEYENYLYSLENNGIPKINWDEWNKEKKEETVEHIYPQTPDQKDECWNSIFGNFNEEQRRKLCNSLGNLLIISRAKNSMEQNFCFERKRGDENNKGYYKGTFSEIEVSRMQEWGPVQILERGLKLLKFMEDRWQIDLGNIEKKIEILDLEFLKGEWNSEKKG